MRICAKQWPVRVRLNLVYKPKGHTIHQRRKSTNGRNWWAQGVVDCRAVFNLMLSIELLFQLTQKKIIGPRLRCVRINVEAEHRDLLPSLPAAGTGIVETNTVKAFETLQRGMTSHCRQGRYECSNSDIKLRIGSTNEDWGGRGQRSGRGWWGWTKVMDHGEKEMNITQRRQEREHWQLKQGLWKV